MSIEHLVAPQPVLRETLAKCAKLNIPAQVTIELTYRCNLKCAHCYVDLEENDTLTFDEWKAVLGQLKDAGTIYLLFTGGEVMTHPFFLELASYARSSGFFISLLTNCTPVTPDIAETIAALRPLYLGTSLYGATAATHEMITQVPGSFQKTIEGMKLLIRYGIVPTVQITIMGNNVKEVSSMKELVESLGAAMMIDIGIVPSKSGADFPFQHEADVEDLICSGWQPETPAILEDLGPQPCKAGKGICSISPNGDVFPCVLFPLKLGNLRQSNFSSIWRLEPSAELRYLRSMTRHSFHACTECEIRDYCQRCTGTVYLESGGFDGPGSSACRQADVRWRLSEAVEVET